MISTGNYKFAAVSLACRAKFGLCRGLFQCAPYAMALATQSGRLIEANSIFMNYFNVTVKVPFCFAFY